MNSDNWIDLVPTAAKPAVYAYRYRHAIQKYWTKALVKIGRGAADIIVTGRAGAGKSVLISHYHGEANSLDWTLPDSSDNVEIKPITIGDWTKIVSVVPGQDNAERAQALDSALNTQESLDGVIHVVDWGYTAIRDDAIRKSMVDLKGIGTIKKVRAHNLQLELQDFTMLLESIKLSKRNGRGPKWLAIVVNKIDLYESELDSARQYYHPESGGAFSSVISDLYTSVGKANIRVECIPVCAQPEAFEWNGHKVKSQIDSVMKQRNYLRFFVDKMALLQSSVGK